ncbi:hypothetical protein EOM82_00325 [bacterium]|nr:hypothetical protein [bacterium]
MIYKYDDNKLKKISFISMKDINNKEKDLENLISLNLLDTFFEASPIMPIYQEKSYEKKADIYALDEKGCLIIFELKREDTNADTVVQILRYTQEAGRFSLQFLENKYRKYIGNENVSLIEAHREAFGLECPLQANQINNRQKSIIIGTSTNQDLIEAVSYWQERVIEKMNYNEYNKLELI